MGRKRTKDLHLPRWVQRKGRKYWFVKDNRWIDLGENYGDALVAYASLVGKMRRSDKFGDVAKAFLIDRSTGEDALSENTLELYANNSKRVIPVFGDMRLQDITQHMVFSYVKTAKGPAMANRDRTFMSAVYTYAANTFYSGPDPTKEIHYRRKEKPGERYITDDEILRMVDVAKPNVAAAIWLLYLVGCRIRDALAIRVSDVTDTSLTYGNTKGKRGVTLEMTPALRSAVDDCLAVGRQINREFVIEKVATNKRPAGPYTYSGFRTQWINALKKAGIEEWATLHDVRRKAGSDVDSDARATELLDHKDSKVTKRVYRAKPKRIKPTE